ncbi:MAG: DUF1232 domain-containing protein [Rhodocyclaceae bacterium]|jgi:uncharacterized membrane protein YkvA (DUF1232 family)|nr:MAG: DUF1232 domain-containing protein [Rhodocyclaceae bacterium]
MAWLARLKDAARNLKRELTALTYAARDKRTPWAAKLLLAFVLAYAASPIDLIPDFVPVLGYLDEVVLLPLGIWLALRMIPPEVMAEARARAGERHANGRPDYRAAALIVLVWVAAIWLSARWLVKLWPAD